MERFTGRIAVVTGSSSGIGKEIVKGLVKRGIIVVGLARNVENQQKLAAEILTHPKIFTGKFHPIKCDITQEKEIQDAFEEIRTSIGPMSILVNDAAFLGPYQALTEMDSSTYQQIFDTNVKGSWMCIKEALRSMSQLPIVGHIVNINSIASLHEFQADMFPLYAASKDALRTISRTLRRQILQKKLNIKVTDISPGGTDTTMTRDPSSTFIAADGKDMLPAEEVAKACISVLDTAPDVLITELTIIARQTKFQ